MFRLPAVASGVLLASAFTTSSMAEERETASFAVDTEVKISSDQRTHGISDSLKRPGAKLSVNVAHESGLVALIEFSSVSKKQFLGGDGYGVTLGGGYRFGDPEAWHFGAGLAAEIFPGAKFDAPHGFDLESGTPTNVRTTRYNSSFAVAEFGYGALEGRLLNVLSKTYRGADTGGVCGTMLALMPDPGRALDCYGRGDKNSRGSWLVELGYKIPLTPVTTLNLHAGSQKIKNFKEANFSDYSIGLTHKWSGFIWSVDWIKTHTKVRELYVVQDGTKLKATDSSALVFSVARKF